MLSYRHNAPPLKKKAAKTKTKPKVKGKAEYRKRSKPINSAETVSDFQRQTG